MHRKRWDVLADLVIENDFRTYIELGVMNAADAKKGDFDSLKDLCDFVGAEFDLQAAMTQIKPNLFQGA